MGRKVGTESSTLQYLTGGEVQGVRQEPWRGISYRTTWAVPQSTTVTNSKPTVALWWAAHDGSTGLTPSQFCHELPTIQQRTSGVNLPRPWTRSRLSVWAVLHQKRAPLDEVADQVPGLAPQQVQPLVLESYKLAEAGVRDGDQEPSH